MILFVLLSLDFAGFAHGDVRGTAAAVIALVLAVVALVLEVRGGRVP